MADSRSQGTNKHSNSKTEIRTSAVGRQIKLIEKAKENKKIKMLDKSDVSLIDIKDETNIGLGQADESRLISLTQDDSQDLAETHKISDNDVIIEDSDTVMTSTQKDSCEIGIGQDLLLGLVHTSDEEVSCEGCSAKLGNEVNCAECECCLKWFCYSCISDNERVTRKQINHQMKIIEMTEEIEGLLWACKKCMEKIRIDIETRRKKDLRK